jgi:hypothetical protein
MNSSLAESARTCKSLFRTAPNYSLKRTAANGYGKLKLIRGRRRLAQALCADIEPTLKTISESAAVG